jgi:hypothetical protein
MDQLHSAMFDKDDDFGPAADEEEFDPKADVEFETSDEEYNMRIAPREVCPSSNYAHKMNQI